MGKCHAVTVWYWKVKWGETQDLFSKSEVIPKWRATPIKVTRAHFLVVTIKSYTVGDILTWFQVWLLTEKDHVEKTSFIFTKIDHVLMDELN